MPSGSRGSAASARCASPPCRAASGMPSAVPTTSSTRGSRSAARRSGARSTARANCSMARLCCGSVASRASARCSSPGRTARRKAAMAAPASPLPPDRLPDMARAYPSGVRGAGPGSDRRADGAGGRPSTSSSWRMTRRAIFNAT